MASDGKLYEPRALWDVVKFTPSSTTAITRTTFARRSFMNGTQRAININRLAICPVGFALRSQDGVTPTVNFRYENSMAVIGRALIRVNAPFRRHLSRNQIVMNSYRPRATWMPRPLNSPTITSSLWGISRLQFDKKLVLPRLGTVSFAMTAVPYQPVSNNIWGGANPQLVSTSVCFQQDGGQMNGAARFDGGPTVLDGIFPTAFNAFGVALDDEYGKTNPITNINNWPASGVFSNRRFDQENPSRSGSAIVDSINVHIDQIDYDAALGTGTAGEGVGADAVAAPLSTCIGCQMKTVSGGSDENWWRPGAPMALVLDTITPALVFPFDQAITLPPGDTLDVELEYPAYGAGHGDIHSYLFGVSLNGYAIIE